MHSVFFDRFAAARMHVAYLRLPLLWFLLLKPAHAHKGSACGKIR